MQNTNDIPTELTISECCKICGKSHIYVRNLQKAMELPILGKGSLYPRTYLHFLQRVIALRTFSVSLEDISDLFVKEKNILRLLKMDSLVNSPTWYLDQCGDKGDSDCHLLLTGYNVGFPITQGTIQANLDFGSREKELFNGKEMGEDVRRSLDGYLKLLAEIKSRVTREKPVLQQALKWAKESFVD